MVKASNHILIQLESKIILFSLLLMHHSSFYLSFLSLPLAKPSLQNHYLFESKRSQNKSPSTRHLTLKTVIKNDLVRKTQIEFSHHLCKSFDIRHHMREM